MPISGLFSVGRVENNTPQVPVFMDQIQWCGETADRYRNVTSGDKHYVEEKSRGRGKGQDWAEGFVFDMEWSVTSLIR